MNKYKKQFQIGFSILGIACALVLVFYFARTARYKSKIKQMSFANIDISAIEDGMYTGESDVDFIKAIAKVTVQDGQITHIELVEHYHDRGKAAESIIDDIVARQQLDVDTISGATNSSKVIRKAVENALTSNMNQ